MYKHKQHHGGKGDANTRIDKAAFDSGYDAIDWSKGKDEPKETSKSQQSLPNK